MPELLAYTISVMATAMAAGVLIGVLGAFASHTRD